MSTRRKNHRSNVVVLAQAYPKGKVELIRLAVMATAAFMAFVSFFFFSFSCTQWRELMSES
jgi:hypothetical protein